MKYLNIICFLLFLAITVYAQPNYYNVVNNTLVNSDTPQIAWEQTTINIKPIPNSNFPYYIDYDNANSSLASAMEVWNNLGLYQLNETSGVGISIIFTTLLPLQEVLL